MDCWKREVIAPCGILCGTDANQEWLLPWWWERYSAENDFPVTFVDFGMSPQAQKWCQDRGELVALDVDMGFMKSKEEIDPALVRAWDPWIDWSARPAWFKKPFALLHTPYARTVWLDLDCEVLRPIDSLFTQCQGEKIALARHRHDDLPRFHKDIYYNGGVIVFEHKAPLIAQWTEEIKTRNQCFAGDDFLLSALIFEKSVEVVELPLIYHWNMTKGMLLEAVIIHWIGRKHAIKLYGGLKPLYESFYNALES